MVITSILKIQYGKHSVKYSAALETGINLFLKCFESTDLKNLKETTVRKFEGVQYLNKETFSGYELPVTNYDIILCDSHHFTSRDKTNSIT